MESIIVYCTLKLFHCLLLFVSSRFLISFGPFSFLFPFFWRYFTEKKAEKVMLIMLISECHYVDVKQ